MFRFTFRGRATIIHPPHMIGGQLPLSIENLIGLPIFSAGTNIHRHLSHGIVAIDVGLHRDCHQ